MLAVAAGQFGIDSHDGAPDHGGGALLELAVGVVAGLAVGTMSAWLLTVGSRRHWMTTGARPLGTLAAALGSFALAVAFSGNGFIAAFLAGIAFRAMLDEQTVDADAAVELPELVGEVLAFAVWFLFGAALVPIALHNFGFTLLAYAVLSLTVVRIVPVAVSLLGAGLDRRTVAFVGWFGPRGLASVVFALLAVEQLGEIAVVERVVAVVALTVFLSVVLHGVTAGPLGRRYVHLEQADEDPGGGPRSRRTSRGLRSPDTLRSDQP
jgi:sodium/hydrogen antiporter